MPTQIPCSDYVETKGLIFFARMLDKIRLHAKGLLPRDYNRGFSPPDCLDARFCNYWEVDYDELVKRTLDGGTDEEILDWCFKGGWPCEERILCWNSFVTTRGWRDESSDELRQVKEANGLANRNDIQTWLDFHDVDEGRKPKFA
jgi:gluconokinase